MTLTWKRVALLTALCCMTAVPRVAPAAASRQAGQAVDRSVVISIDDLPYTGEPNTIERARRVVEEMTWALREHEVPSEGFVTGARIWVEDQVDERLDLLRLWRDSGMRLGGHGFHHVSFQTTPYDEYFDDVIAGLRFPIEIMGEVDGSVRYYRHPFNHTGPSPEDKQRFADAMADRGVTVVPFTVEHADYVFSALYDDAQIAGDVGQMERIGDAYLRHLDTAFDFAEELAHETFGRSIPHIFVIHANGVNAAYLNAMLRRLAERGYRFVSMDDALADPAYDTPDTYVNRFGVSWLHRWRHGMGLENALRREPDPPVWVLEAYQAR